MASSLHNSRTSDRARASTSRCYELECSTEIAPRGRDAPVHTSESKGLLHTVKGMVRKAGTAILGGGESDETYDGHSHVDLSALPAWFSNKKKDATSNNDVRCPDRSPLESPQRLPQHSQRSHQTSTKGRRANTDLFECFDNLENEVTTFKVSCQ